MFITSIFSPVAFFICLRETLEAGIIIAVLLGFVKQLIPTHPPPPIPISTRSSTELLSDQDGNSYGTPAEAGSSTDTDTAARRLSTESNREQMELGRIADREAMIRAMQWQIWTGSVLGGAIAAVVGAVFLYVFYRYTHDLWQDAENLWEGGFSLIASILILVMGLAFLRLPHAQTKWRLKLLSAYRDQALHIHHGHDGPEPLAEDQGDDEGLEDLTVGGEQGLHLRQKAERRAKEGKMILFGLPLITVLREGLEGVVFLGGIGLSEDPLAIAGGAIVGLVVGAIIAFTLFTSTSPLSLRRFTTLSTIILFMIGAGLASRAAYSLERQYFINGVGVQAAEAGTGPGSYRVAGNIWKLTYGNPEPGAQDGNGYWQLAQSLVGWNNVGTVWTVSTYISYWLVIVVTLVYMKWKEGRTEIYGIRSKRGWQRELARKLKNREQGEEQGLLSGNVPAGRDE